MKFGIIGNTTKEGLEKTVLAVVHKLKTSKAQFVVEEEIVAKGKAVAREVPEEFRRTLEQCINESDMVVAIGGDGTILGVARLIGKKQTPILGINLGKLGFLAELAPEEIERVVGAILSNDYVVEERILLEGTFPQLPGKRVFAMNDIVVDKGREPVLIDLETYIDDEFAVTYRADGLVISTPTGSTAYALSNGGPIVIPTSDVIGLTPVAPHTLNGRPLIVPGKSAIRVVAQSDGEEIAFYGDGAPICVIPPPAEVDIRQASHTVRLVKRTGRSYFDVLRAKLLWGHDPRRKG